MAKGSRGGKGGSNSVAGIAAAVSTSTANPVTRAVAFTDKDASDLIAQLDDTYTDPDFVDARKLYIANDQTNTNGFSISQNLNFKLDNGLPLNVTERFVDSNLQAGMHDLGKDSTLQRFAHDDILKAMGVSDYTKLTDAQLQQRLVGTTFSTTSYMSTSYDGSKSPFAPGNMLGGGREVVMNLKVGKATKVFFGNKKQSEVVINKGTNFRVTGIRYDGSYATPRNGRTKPRIVLDIETY